MAPVPPVAPELTDCCPARPRTGGPGHKPSSTADSEFLPRWAQEGQVSGDESEPHFGWAGQKQSVANGRSKATCKAPASEWQTLPRILECRLGLGYAAMADAGLDHLELGKWRLSVCLVLMRAALKLCLALVRV